MQRTLLFLLCTIIPCALLAQNTTNKLFSKKQKDVAYKIEAGVLAGNGSEDNQKSAPFSMLGTVSIKIAPKLWIGAGSGVEFLKETCVPAFASVEYRLKNSKNTPYLFGKGGYNFPIEDNNSFHNFSTTIGNNLEAKGGWLGNTGVGYICEVNNTLTFSLALGYRYQRLQYKGDKYNYQLDMDMHRLSIHLGIIF